LGIDGIVQFAGFIFDAIVPIAEGSWEPDVSGANGPAVNGDSDSCADIVDDEAATPQKVHRERATTIVVRETA